MKKLFLFLTAMLCVAMLSPPVFAADADAYAIYQKSVKKLRAVSSMEFSTSLKLFDENGKEYMSLKETAKMLRTSDKKLQMEAFIADTYGSQTLSANRSYYKDGYIYTARSDGSRYKIKDGNESLFNNALQMYWDLDSDEAEELFKTAKVEEVDGGIKITVKQEISNTLDPKDYGLQGSSVTNTASGALVIMIGKDGMLKSCSKTYMEYTVSDGDIYVRSKESRLIKVKSVNSAVTIDFPPDLDTYKTIPITR